MSLISFSKELQTPRQIPKTGKGDINIHLVSNLCCPSPQPLWYYNRHLIKKWTNYHRNDRTYSGSHGEALAVLRLNHVMNVWQSPCSSHPTGSSGTPVHPALSVTVPLWKNWEWRRGITVFPWQTLFPLEFNLDLIKCLVNLNYTQIEIKNGLTRFNSDVKDHTIALQ